MKLFTTLMAAGAVVAAAGTAYAAPVSYDATSFGSNDTNITNDHSLYLFDDAFGLGNKYDFSPAGVFNFDAKVYGRLTGDVVSQVDNTNGFSVDFNYDANIPVTPASYKNGGASTQQADVTFLNMVSGTLTGFGGILDGVVLAVSRAPSNGPETTQVGTGANDKTATDFGMSNWFTIACTAGCSLFNFNPNATQGDVNLNLEATNRVPPPVPLPAAAWMLLAGLGGLAAMKRRKEA